MNKSKAKAVLFIINSSFFFTLMNIFVRLSGDLPSVQKSFFRNLVAAIVALVVVLKNKDTIHIGRQNLKFYFLRSALGTVGILSNFYAVDHLVLSNATMLNKMSPFFVLVFSFFILKEKLKPIQIGAVILAFVGSLFVIKPTFANIQLMPSLVGLLGGMAAGFAYTMVRLLSLKGEKGSMIVLFFSTFSCIVVLPYVIFKGEPMSAKQVILLILAGTCAAVAQFSITAAYSHAPGREVSVYDYSQVIFAAILGFIIFSDIPDAFSFAGYALIITAAVVIFIYTNYWKQSDKSKKKSTV